MAPQPPLTPVHFFSHGSTMMLGEESQSADYWKTCGDSAIAHGIEHIVMMGAHWASLNDVIEIASNPTPEKSPVAYVHPSKYTTYPLNPDLPMADRICSILQSSGFNAKLNPRFDWIHDVYLILIRMFPAGSPPTTIISMNARYDPHYHMRVGSALAPLRDPKEKTLFIGTGGAVHNLYRNQWAPMLQYRDNFGFATPPEKWALDFRQEFADAFIPGSVPAPPSSYPKGKLQPGQIKRVGKSGGPGLRRRVTALMKIPGYRDAHGTDDHFMPALFVAGLCGGWESEGCRGELGAEDWELTNMCNSQFTLGEWPKAVAV